MLLKSDFSGTHSFVRWMIVDQALRLRVFFFFLFLFLQLFYTKRWNLKQCNILIEHSEKREPTSCFHLLATTNSKRFSPWMCLCVYLLKCFINFIPRRLQYIDANGKKKNRLVNSKLFEAYTKNQERRGILSSFLYCSSLRDRNIAKLKQLFASL